MFRTLSLGLFALTLCFAQIRSATIVGTVSDSSGAPLAGAQVRVLSEETGAPYSAKTNNSGEFAVPYLQLGRYTVTVTAAGFGEMQRTGIGVGTAETLRADFTMKVQGVSTSIEVMASGVELQTESPTVQAAIDDSIIDGVPNPSHNPYYYATLLAGVVGRSAMNDSQSVNSFGIGVDGRRQLSAFSVNGGEAFTNDVQLDGVSVQSSSWNEAAVLPNGDGIKEVRAITNSFSAEYGRGQGVISLTTKSGANQFHGTLFDRVRNEALNANTFNNNTRGISRAPFKVNSYGGTIGGPIKRNRMFFFVSYEGLKHSDAVDYMKTVPTAAQKKGDFSQTVVNVNTAPVKLSLFDPFSGALVGSNSYQRTPFPNSVLPQQNLNPYTLKLAQFYPDPNRTPDDAYNLNNYFHRGIRQFSRNSINSRADYRMDKHSLYSTFGLSKGNIVTPPSWDNANNPFFSRNDFIGPHLADNNPYGGIGDTIVVTPTLVADIRYTVTRINTANEATIYPDFKYSDYGVPKAISDIITIPGAALEVTSFGPWSSLNSTNNLHKQEHQTNHVVVGSMTKLAGKWTFKWGGEHRASYLNSKDPEQAVQIRSNAAYTGQYAQANGTSVPSGVSQPANLAGLSSASVLLGVGDLFVKQGRSPLTALGIKYTALYTQNDWRVNKRLTLNFGLRWDYQPGPTDRFNRITGVDPSGTNPFGGKGAFVFPGVNGASRNLWNNHYKEFQPRIGYAWRLGGSTVLRGGWGMGYLPTNTGTTGTSGFFGMEAFSNFTDPVINRLSDSKPSGAFNSVYDPATGVGVNRVVKEFGPDPSQVALYGNSGDTTFKFVKDFKNGHYQQWNVTLETRLGKRWLVSAGYVGSKAVDLPYARLGLNTIQTLPQSTLDSWKSGYVSSLGTNPANDVVCNPLQTQQTCNSASTGSASGPLIPFLGYWANRTVTRLQANYQYPLFTNALLNQAFGYSYYNALQLRATREWSNGLLVNVNYSWSKSLAVSSSEVQANGFADTAPGGSNGFNGGMLDVVNLRNNKSLSLQDIPHRLSATWVYELPFGKKKRFATNIAALDALAGGWKVGGNVIAQSGAPLQINGGSGGSIYDRPDRIAGQPVEVPKELQRWYDGKTTVTLPDGRQTTPCAFCFLKYNVDAFQGRLLKDAQGKPMLNKAGNGYLTDLYWASGGSISYGDLRGNGMWNANLTVERNFRVTERVVAELSGRVTNFLNRAEFRPTISGNVGGVSTQLITDVNNKHNIAPGVATGENYGTYGLSTYDPRQVEVQLKVRF